MASKVHIICAKCGSDKDVHFNIKKQTFDDEGVSIVCDNCGELTGVAEWNEHNNKADKNPETDENGYYVLEE